MLFRSVRYGVASGVPVAVTPLPIFDDVKALVYFLPGFTPEDLAQGIIAQIQMQKSNSGKISEIHQLAKEWRYAHLYSKLGLRIYNIALALLAGASIKKKDF